MGQNSNWHTREDQKKLLKNLINVRGVALEDRVFEVLKLHFGQANVRLNQIFERPGATERERVEIDVWVKNRKHYYVIEVKRSSYEWVFIRGPNTTQHFHLLKDGKKGFGVHAFPSNKIVNSISIADSCVEVVVDTSSSESQLCEQSKKKNSGNISLPEIPQGREVVRPAVRQLLKHVETLAFTEMYPTRSSSPRPTLDHLFLPIIVTNANLYLTSYESDDIDQHGDIEKLGNLKEVSWIAFNYPEILRWDRDLKQIVKHHGLPDEWEYKEWDYDSSHLKSVIVVRYSKLREFLNLINR